ncbi:MAG: NAD-dependent epimerase/dehydratase family protein, partial [Mariprofundaceae bacterium]|nr:NAD-dependent epimerase/dehydratase family protein [Mariprofundaceae bacterium]
WGGLPNYWSTHHFSEELPNHYRFLENLIKTGLPTLVGVGTCFEYGMQSGPLSEDISISPDNCYGYAKASLLCQLNFLKRTHEFNFSWARLFYPYGSGQGPKSLLSQLKTAVGQGDSVFNMSGGEQLRDFIKVEDVASKLAILAQIEANCGVVNICSGKPTSVRGIVEQWCREFNWEIELNLGYYPYPNYEPMAFWGESKKWNQLVP